jgi:hypothetical protein
MRRNKMSTKYQTLKYPLTSINFIGDNTIAIEIDGVSAGMLYIPEGTMQAFLDMIFRDDSPPAVHGYFGGKDLGSCLSINVKDLEDSTILLSQYGVIHTLEELKRGYNTILENWHMYQ